MLLRVMLYVYAMCCTLKCILGQNDFKLGLIFINGEGESVLDQ